MIKQQKQVRSKKRSVRILIALVVLCCLFFAVPVADPLFSDPYSTILESEEGALLSAQLATDEQWRFPQRAEVCNKFETCILMFEDEYFYQHPGINPVSIARAIRQNWKAGKVVSGGSTLSMQLVRLARKNKRRTLWQKLIETIWALRIELRYTKKELLSLYAAHAPFGGNVVGLEAAAWRYYNRPPESLSWAESATLAVLPNAPALIHLSRNRALLLKKRNRLLDKLEAKGILDALSLELAKSEELPDQPLRLPQAAQHLLHQHIAKGKRGQRIQSTLRKELQEQTNRLVQQYHQQLKQNEVYNAAVLIVDNHTNEILAYVGNTKGEGTSEGHQVDIITAKRSTGSLLKPLLYGMAWQEGLLLPTSLMADVPTNYGGYAPKNFSKKYNGAVVSAEALVRSLNVPAVRLLRSYGVERFYDNLKQFPLPSINKGANHYGLSIILGGAEASLLEICTTYKGLSQSLYNVQERNYKYSSLDYKFPGSIKQDNEKLSGDDAFPMLEASAIWALVEQLKNVNRPSDEQGWESFTGRKKIAWKTGTSFGLRDAWAVGICPEYTIGVWVGNADGEGRPGLTGVQEAAPLLFDAFDLLPATSWYEPPYDELYPMEVCEQSGFGKGINCLSVDTLLLGKGSKNIKNCPYHQSIQLNKDRTQRVNSSCYPIAEMKRESYLVLPPLMEWYYKKKNPRHKVLPAWKKSCIQEKTKPMDFISPSNAEQIFIPIGLEGQKESVIVEIAHRNPKATIYWHLDDKYLGKTNGIHMKELSPSIGLHVLSLVDHEGNSLTKQIEILP